MVNIDIIMPGDHAEDEFTVYVSNIRNSLNGSGRIVCGAFLVLQMDHGAMQAREEGVEMSDLAEWNKSFASTLQEVFAEEKKGYSVYNTLVRLLGSYMQLTLNYTLPQTFQEEVKDALKNKVT